MIEAGPLLYLLAAAAALMSVGFYAGWRVARFERDLDLLEPDGVDD